MAARALKDLDAAVPPLTRAFTMQIRTAHQNAGSPSFTVLDSRNIRAGRGTLAKATLSRILTPDPAAKDQSLPAWSYYEGLLYALDVDPAPFQAQWQAAQEEWQARARGESVAAAAVSAGAAAAADTVAANDTIVAADTIPVAANASADSIATALPAVRQPISAGTTVLASVMELEPRPESGLAPQTVALPIPAKRRRSVLLPASIVGSLAVALAIGAFAFIGGSHSQPKPDAALPDTAPNTAQETAILVTTAPPKTVSGKIVRTWNQDANNGHGGSIGVLVFPTPFSLNGSTGPRHDGDIVEVVCHTDHGRMTHERLDTGHPNSTGWFQIYYVDRLWWVADHYISFARGVQVPECAG